VKTNPIFRLQIFGTAPGNRRPPRRSCRIADWAQPCGGTPLGTCRPWGRLHEQTRWARANCAKQTQSAGPGPSGHRPGDLTGWAFSRADCAKQTQFAFARNEEQVLWGKGVMVNSTYMGPWKNKANFGQAGGEGSPTALSLGRIARNKPNLPIRARVGTGRGTSLVGPPLTLIAPNKPNLLLSETKGKCLGGKELWLIAPTRGLGKTKPIARSGAPRRCPAGGPGRVTNGAIVRANRAKQTQFGP
jgi:hypothetical protein